MHPNAPAVRFLRAVEKHFSVLVFDESQHFGLVGVFLAHDAFSGVLGIGHFIHLALLARRL